MFLCRSTVDHFTHRGSNVYAATLDIKKAFDRVNHYKLFVSLLKVGVPLCIIAVLADWYSKMFVMVKWNGFLCVVESGKAVFYHQIFLMCL